MRWWAPILVMLVGCASPPPLPAACMRSLTTNLGMAGGGEDWVLEYETRCIVIDDQPLCFVTECELKVGSPVWPGRSL